MQTIAVDPLVGLWRDWYRVDVRREFHNLSEFDLRTCSDCFLRYFTPELLSGSGELYAQLEKIDWYYRAVKWEYKVALEDLRACKNILEVGCGSSNFMTLALQNPGLKIEGLEQNVDAIKEATDRGLSVRLGTVEEAARNSPAKYDAVCCFQVLEHVPKPGEFLTACCELLRPGGKLLFGVPNADSFLRWEWVIFNLPPHHMSRWPLKTLDAIPHFFPLHLKHIKLEPLPEWQICEFVSTYYSVLTRGRGARVQPKIVNLLSGLLRSSGLRRWLRGHTVYTCFERT